MIAASYSETPSVFIAPSRIPGAGRGLFAAKPFITGELVAIAIRATRHPLGPIGGGQVITDEAGRWVNHSSQPSLALRRLLDGNWWLIATCPIAAGEEFTTDYDRTPPLVEKAAGRYTTGGRDAPAR